MKTEKKRIKKKIVLDGNLIGTLETGKSALVYCNGRTYFTSRVIKIHKRNKQHIHFETMNAHYYLALKPNTSAVISMFPPIDKRLKQQILTKSTTVFQERINMSDITIKIKTIDSVAA